MSGFAIGQRVMVCEWQGNPSADMDMNGYYGYVTTSPHVSEMVPVSLIGRAGVPAREDELDTTGAAPWFFYPDELEHAD
jgi:hypothetical protein